MHTPSSCFFLCHFFPVVGEAASNVKSWSFYLLSGVLFEVIDFSFLSEVLDFSILHCGWLWRKAVKESKVSSFSQLEYDGNGHFLFSPGV